jgi:hypothetical protein
MISCGRGRRGGSAIDRCKHKRESLRGRLLAQNRLARSFAIGYTGREQKTASIVCEENYRANHEMHASCGSRVWKKQITRPQPRDFGRSSLDCVPPEPSNGT